MKKLLSLGLVLAIAACGAHSDKKGAGINLGKQPTAITLAATNNDTALSVSHAAVGTIVRLTPFSGGSTVTGFDSSGAEDGDLIMLRNDGTSDSITLTNGDTGSLVHNRMLLPSAASVVIAPKTSMFIEYDSTAASWVAGPGLPNAPSFAGTVTMSGAVTTTSGSVTTGQETITSGAASLTKKSNLSVTATVAFTLADGTVTGQIKQFEVTVAATTPLGTLTITTPAGSESATHVFTAVGQQLTLQWNGTGWHIIGKVRNGHQLLVIGTTLTAGYDMALTYDLSVTSTVVSTTTKALPNGSVAGEVAHLDCTTAATSASGTLGFVGLSRLGAAVTGIAGIGNGASDKSLAVDLVWDGTAWQIIGLGTNTGVTISMEDTWNEYRNAA